jgi:ATP-dependent DNA helicase RecG
MLAAPQTYVHPDSDLPLTIATRIVIDNQTILFFAVSKGTTEIYQLPDGRCVRRKDKSTMPEAARRILFDRQEIKSREYDRQFVDGALVNDLDVELLQTLADEYLRGLSVERYLQQIGVAEYALGGLRLRMASLLLFGKDIQRWHPRSQVRILKVAGIQLKSGEHYNVQSDELVQGNIFDLLVKAWEKLRPFLAYKTQFGADARFEQKYIYPEWACREALVNAVAHRDYSVHNGIDVFIFDDRMEIKNPGGLLSTLTVEDLENLEGAHESRNALIAKVLRENNFMRELGEGMKRMFELMEQSELEKPKLNSDSTAFSITLPNKSVFSSRQDEWLLMFKDYNLSSLQKKIVVLGIDDKEISPHDIYNAMNTTDRNIYDKEVTGLRTAKILISIRRPMEATKYANQHMIAKAKVPRFKVQIPQSKSTKGDLDSSQEKLSAQGKKELGRKVFVKGIPLATTIKQLRDLFGSCGEIEQIDFSKKHYRHRRWGFCFVHYKNAESAQKAVKQLNGTELNGLVLTVEEYKLN